jgi:hypothetical protein
MRGGFIVILAVAAAVAAGESTRAQRLAGLRAIPGGIVYARHAILGGSHYAYTEALSDAQAERTFIPGGALCRMTFGSDGEPREEVLLEAGKDGVIRDADVSLDGGRVLFAWKKSDRGDDFHLYEMELATRQVRQLTDTPQVADYEGCYLPDGTIMFNSSRCVQTVDCWTTEVSTLYKCDADGKNVRRIAFDQVHDNYPTLAPDGRVLYTRWEYNDRSQMFPQPLYQMNPDGTMQTAVYGEVSWFPTTILHARGIPGTQKILAIASGHHVRQVGKLILIDPLKGRQEAEGVTLVAPVRETKAERIDTYGQNGPIYLYPYPLNEAEFLVVCNPDGWKDGRGRGFGLYWMNVDGDCELLTDRNALPPGRPVPVMARNVAVRPSLLPAKNAPKTGTFYIQDVYAGTTAGVKRGTVKALRAVTIAFRPVWIGQNGNGGPGGAAMVSTPVACNNGTWDPKTILGDVPVAEDGSVFFTAPAQTPIYFQLLDEKGRMIHSMRSWTVLQPGENASCVGCHESKNSAPPVMAKGTMAKTPAMLKPFIGGVAGFSFPKMVQPILNRRCVGCHSQEGIAKARMARQPVAKGDLTDAPVPDTRSKRQWTQGYVTLTHNGRDTDPVVNWISAASLPTPLAPYTYGSNESRLFAMLDNGHGRTTPEERAVLAAWVDLCVPFCEDYREAALWTPEEIALYDSRMAKREKVK